MLSPNLNPKKIKIKRMLFFAPLALQSLVDGFAPTKFGFHCLIPQSHFRATPFKISTKCPFKIRNHLT